MNYMALISMITITWISAYASLFLKKGSMKFNRNNILGLINFHIFVGVSMYIIGTAAYILLLKKNDLSILYPLSALTYVWVLFISKLHLNEQFNKFKILGIVSIIIGVLFIVI